MLDRIAELFPGEWSAVTRAVVVLVAAALAGVAAHVVVFAVAMRLARRAESLLDARFVGRVRSAARVLLPLLGIQLALPAAALPPDVLGPLRHGLAIAMILASAWALIAAIDGVEWLLLRRYRIDVSDNLQARRVHTQLRVITRIVDVVVVIVALSSVLMTFPRVRQVGASLLASAGIAGIVVGFAARPTISNLIAGLQVALAAPIRLDDVVIVEGEWGRVEEITTTYVVVKIWDERRSIVPLSWFLENPFQNWTRTSADLLGTVFLHVDYAVPLQDLRAELERVCEGADDWDGRVALVQVTDCTERTMQVRALVSASDSGRLWNLRCLVRERLLDYLRREHPNALPRIRAEIEGGRPESDREG